MSAALEEGGSYRPNFGAAGRRRRARVAWAGAALAVACFVVLVAIDASWPLRLLVGLPAGAAFVSGLQVRRNTCVAHASSGVLENEDLSTTRVDAAFAEASRRVAATIWRDGLLGTALVAVASAATALLR